MQGSQTESQHFASATTSVESSGPGKEKLPSIQKDLTELEAQIRAAEEEDARYQGGLVKTLTTVRLGLLRQTHAMLQQRAKAWFFGIGLKYTVDGKPFTPPADRRELLTAVQKQIEDTRRKLLDEEQEAGRYSGGLVQALSLTTVATIRNTLAMLEQKRLALEYGLPQYVGFTNIETTAPSSSSAAQPAATPEKLQPATPAKEESWRVVAIRSKITETNDSWWKYAWRLTLANDSDQPMLFDAGVEFQDAEGFIISTNSKSGLPVAARSEETFTGYDLIQLPQAQRVAKTVAQVRRRR